MTTTPKRCDCGHAPSAHSEISTGYGTDHDGKTACYECCAKWDRETMTKEGRHTLYLTKKDGKHEITNWPGSLRFPVLNVRTGRHNMAGKRYTAYFYGPDGKLWSGTRYGDMTEIAHCRRLKTV